MPREDVAVDHVHGYPETLWPHVRLVDVATRDRHDLGGVRGGRGCGHEGEQGQGAHVKELLEQLLDHAEDGVSHGVLGGRGPADG
jgi:hypothetical protein